MPASLTQSLPIADMQQAQLMMVAGFVMLGWVLARRQLRMRKRVNQDSRTANRELEKIRNQTTPAVPLSDAPPETQRWQAAMFDLQRELKAELDSRIVIVQTLLRQVDSRIALLASLQNGAPAAKKPIGMSTADADQIELLVRKGYTSQEISQQTGLPLGDVELTIATIRV